MDVPSLSAMFYVPVGAGLGHSLCEIDYVKMSCADFLWFPQKALPSEDFPNSRTGLWLTAPCPAR